jgi:hypothetical protein
MGWGLILKQVYFNRVVKGDLPSVLDDADYIIKSARERIIILAASTPRAIEHSGDENFKTDWNEHIRTEVDSIMDDLEEQIIRRYLARQCIENPEDVTEG